MAADRLPLDHALVVAFPGPASATGDDVVELHLHGGTAVVAAVCCELLRLGLAPARPGAFTRAAFDNGKLDLGQVEALGDLVAAETEAQRRAALSRVGGMVGAAVDGWRATLLDVRANLEATLDFADEDGVGAGLTSPAREALAALETDLAAALCDARRGEMLTSGVTVAITGPVNAGKSTLLNALARRDAAMVSPQPGTTRDSVEVRIVIAGVVATMIDTAGLREATDPLEIEGVRRGVKRAAEADLVIAFGEVAPPHAIRVAGHADVTQRHGWHDGRLHLSPLTGQGIDLLEDHLSERVTSLVRPAEVPLLAHHWQTAAVTNARAALFIALEESDPVLVAEALRRTAAALEMLIGRMPDEELLGHIFARFCIGK